MEVSLCLRWCMAGGLARVRPCPPCIFTWVYELFARGRKRRGVRIRSKEESMQANDRNFSRRISRRGKWRRREAKNLLQSSIDKSQKMTTSYKYPLAVRMHHVCAFELVLVENDVDLVCLSVGLGPTAVRRHCFELRWNAARGFELDAIADATRMAAANCTVQSIRMTS